MKGLVYILLGSFLAFIAYAQTSFHYLTGVPATEKSACSTPPHTAPASPPHSQAVAANLYNAACCWALKGQPTEAFQNLDQAIEAGWDKLEHLRQDQDLVGLHGDSRWQPLLDRLAATIARKNAKLNLPLMKELAEIYKQDQDGRLQMAVLEKQKGHTPPQVDSLWKQISLSDNRNIARVTAIIDAYGWPGNSLVGPEGSMTAFLVIQHSTLATMLKYLPLMRQAAAKGEVAPSSLALLEDRVLTTQGKEQIYGSQLHPNPVTGKLELFPIANEAQVDRRRAAVGLGPLAEYLREFDLVYRPTN